MNDIFLINASGQDKPGVTHAITQALTDAGARILDIGQAVIHETLALGILVQINAADAGDDAARACQERIQLACEALGIQVRFQAITLTEYAEWVQHQGKDRHIFTLLAREIGASHLAELTAVITRHGLNIDTISRLSGRVDLVCDESKPRTACIEVSVRGTPPDVLALRADVMELASRLNIDIAFQRDTVYRRNRRLVCFDMDSTLIDAEVIDELAKAAGVGDKVAAITEEAMRGELDFKESFARRMALLEGLDESVLAGIAASLKLTEGAEKLISTLKSLGYKTAILSGGFNYFGRYLQARLGIDYVYANELDIVNGKVTGKVKGIVVDGKRKADLLVMLAETEGITLEQVIAVGDGANDLPMLSVAGLGVAFHAKPLVKASAQHSISNLGLDAILYLLGFRERDLIL